MLISCILRGFDESPTVIIVTSHCTLSHYVVLEEVKSRYRRISDDPFYEDTDII